MAKTKFPDTGRSAVQGITPCWNSVHRIPIGIFPIGNQPDIRGIINGYQEEIDHTSI